MIHLKNIYYFIDKFDSEEIKRLDKKVNIIYRNYKYNYNLKTIKAIKDICRKYKRKFYIANNLHLALELNLDGIYIPSFNKSLKIRYVSKKNFEILGSAHNFKEIYFKKKQGINKIFISPIFEVMKTNKYLGVIKYNLLSKYAYNENIALGGINKHNLKKIKMVNCSGFAGIKYFKNG
tara:strand:- start:522 stop:1055 length:534 start_codon:yes stop_codon:yes gene_type:complete